ERNPKNGNAGIPSVPETEEICKNGNAGISHVLETEEICKNGNAGISHVLETEEICKNGNAGILPRARNRKKSQKRLHAATSLSTFIIQDNKIVCLNCH